MPGADVGGGRIGIKASSLFPALTELGNPKPFLLHVSRERGHAWCREGNGRISFPGVIGAALGEGNTCHQLRDAWLGRANRTSSRNVQALSGQGTRLTALLHVCLAQGRAPLPPPSPSSHQSPHTEGKGSAGGVVLPPTPCYTPFSESTPSTELSASSPHRPIPQLFLQHPPAPCSSLGHCQTGRNRSAGSIHPQWQGTVL